MKTDARHLILNLLLGAAGQQLAAREAVAACALFGIRANSVRVALARLVAAGLVEPAARGQYRLGPEAKPLAADVVTWRGAERRVREWSGDWVAVHVGELGRADRAASRVRDRALAMLGLRELDRGLFVRPDNLNGGVDAARLRLRALGVEPAAAVFVARGFDPDRARRAAALWDGTALTRSYLDTREQLEGWLARAATLEIPEAARESFLLGNEAIRRLVYDPLLPAPLVDVGARRAFVSTVLRFDAAGHAIWNAFLRDGIPSPRSPRCVPARPEQAIETTLEMRP